MVAITERTNHEGKEKKKENKDEKGQKDLIKQGIT